MVEIAETKIKNIGFNTSVETGTKQRSIGDALAKIVTTSIGVSKEMDRQEKERLVLDQKESNLALNDAKLAYQRGVNEYDWQDPANPSSSEWMDFHEKIQGDTKGLYDVMTDLDRSKYDQFYAGRDGETNKLIHAEAKNGAIQLTQQSLQNFTDEDSVDNWVESMDGLVNKKEIFDLAGKQVDSFLATGALDGMSTEQLGKAFPYMDMIKDPSIGAKFKEHVVKLKKEEHAQSLVLEGHNIDVIAATTGQSKDAIKKKTTENITRMVSSEDEEMVQKGIDIANHNNIRIPSFDALGDKINSTVETDPAAAVKYLKKYNDTKGVYQYSDKVEEKLEAYRIVSSIHGLDLSSENGIQSAKHFIDMANDPNAPKVKMPSDEDILELSDPVGWNSESNYGDDKFAYVAPRVRELMKYTGDLEKALDLAENEWDEFDSNAAGLFSSGETPYGMFAQNEDELDLVLEQFSSTTDASDVKIGYAGKDNWALTLKKKDGSEEIIYRNSKQLKAAMKNRTQFKDSLETLDQVLINEDLDDSMRSKQINSDAKEVKTMIQTKKKELEEKLGKKLNSVQTTELEKAVVDGLKENIRIQDLQERGGISYDEESKTVTFSFGNFVEDVFNTMMGVKSDDSPFGKREDGTNKGLGFLGKIEMNDGSVMTEMSIGVKIDGKETLIPSIVPTLSKEEIDHLAKGGKVTDAIVKKAVTHAKSRMKDGLSPFATKEEEMKNEPKEVESATNKEISEFESPIVDAVELAQYKAQIQHESHGESKAESGYYSSPSRITKIFGEKRLQGHKPEELARSSKKLLNVVYGGEWGEKNLGNTEKGDGYKFRGRGFIQITGRANYKKFGDMIGVDLVKNPDKALEPEIADRLALAFWNTVVKPNVKDFNDTKAVTKLINGGYNGLEDRERLFKEYNV